MAGVTGGEGDMSQQTYTALQVGIICVLTFMVAVVLLVEHSRWFN
jgi:hypothetical protein